MAMKELSELKKTIYQRAERNNHLSLLINTNKNKLQSIEKEISASKNVELIIQKVAEETQKNISYKISSLVTQGLKTIFDKGYKFKIDFIPKRNKTECEMYLLKDKRKINPLEADGGGVVDVICFLLRLSFILIKKKEAERILIFDEPFKNINDKTRNIHIKIASFLKMLSKKLEMQFIIITMIPELQEIADCCYEFEKKKDKTITKMVAKTRT